MAGLDFPALTRAYPLSDLAARYGVELRPRGRLLMGRCPFHEDHDPSFLVDPSDEHFHCFACAAHGDVVDFVRRMEGFDIRGAIASLTGASLMARPAGASRSLRAPRPQAGAAPRGPAEYACLAAALQLYRHQLWASPVALAYAEGRGLERATLERCRVGYAAGGTLAAYLRARGLPLAAARRAGLFDRDGQERLAGRLVLPEVRVGRPVWLIGRSVAADAPGPKYMGLPGVKPLLGWEEAVGAPHVTVVEGVFDLLVLRQWREPALALAGTHARPAALRALHRFPRVYLALDADAPGRAAALALREALGPRARVLDVPGVADIAELALRPDGRAAFACCLQASAAPAAA